MPVETPLLPKRGGVVIVFSLLLFVASVTLISPVYSTGDHWTTKQPMPSPRTYSGMTALNGRIYVIGGIDIQGNILASNEVYNPASDTWTSVAPLPVPTDLAGVTVADGQIYVIGGLSWNGGKDYSLTTSVEVYNPQSNNWTSKAPFPHPMDSVMVASVMGLVYAIGGSDINGSQNSTWVYNPRSDGWLPRATMPTYASSLGRAPDQVATVDGKIYVFDQSEGSIGPGRPIDPLPMFNLVYDPSTDTWTHWPSLDYRGARGNPITLSGHSMTAVGTDLYVLGGNDAGLWPSLGCTGRCASDISQITQYNFEYDTLSSTWTRRADMPTGRSGLTLAEVGGVIYAMGGATDTSNSPSPLTTGYTDHNEAYTPCSGSCPAFQPETTLPYISWTLEGIVVVGILGMIAWGIWARTHQTPLRPLDPVDWRNQNKDKDRQ